MAIQSASLSDRGRRKNNEDFAAFFEPTDPAELRDSGCLYIVADGVGGAAKGERASQFAARKIMYEYYQLSTLEPLERLREILQRVNAEIYGYATQNHTRMATTLVAAVVRGGFLYVANIGDSRAYLIRAGSVTQINRDHSIVGEMMEHGEMTEAEAMASKIKNRLTRSLGGDEDVTVDTYAPIPLKTGDKILLCSDGLTRYALREDVALMTTEGKPEEIAQRLVQFANRKGGADNTSVIVALYQGVEVLEPTIVIPRPRPVEQFDTYLTEPGISAIKKRRLNPVAIIAVLILAIALVSVSVFLGGGVIGMLFSTPIPAPTTTAIPPSPVMSPVNPEGVGSILPAATLTPTFTPEPTPTINNSTPDKMSVTSESFSIIATNSCGTIYVFKTSSQQDPIYDAYISRDETFSLTGVVIPGLIFWEGNSVQGFWLETSGPFHSMYPGTGWVFWRNNPCLKLTQGPNSVILNPTTLQFEVVPSIPLGP